MARSHRRRTPMTARGRRLAALATVAAVVGATFSYFALFPASAPAFVRTTLAKVGLADEVPPTPACPLSGEEVATVPHRAALAVKVENAPEARPQSGLNDADVVVEEPVEGGYTRFIAIFHCGDADRVGPVRSARTTDADYLRQLGETVFGYSGGAPSVDRAIAGAGLTDENAGVTVDAYVRDPARTAPHDLYTDTASLWRAGREARSVPITLFAYAERWQGRSRPVRTVHLPYSWVSDVSWTWSRRADGWLRSHGAEPHLLEDGDRVSAANVVIQVVDVRDGEVIDAAGNPSPEVALVGSGRAFVLRDGRIVVGRWERRSLDDPTTFVTKDGTEIALSPGRTWVELLPSSVAVERDR